MSKIITVIKLTNISESIFFSKLLKRIPRIHTDFFFNDLDFISLYTI